VAERYLYLPCIVLLAALALALDKLVKKEKLVFGSGMMAVVGTTAFLGGHLYFETQLRPALEQAEAEAEQKSPHVDPSILQASLDVRDDYFKLLQKEARVYQTTSIRGSLNFKAYPEVIAAASSDQKLIDALSTIEKQSKHLSTLDEIKSNDRLDIREAAADNAIVGGGLIAFVGMVMVFTGEGVRGFDHFVARRDPRPPHSHSAFGPL